LSDPAEIQAPRPDPCPDDPARWLHSTSLLDLGDPRLRVRAQALTQLCKGEREKALAVYAFVKRLPFAKPLQLMPWTARAALDAGRGDSPAKATLLVALLRLAGIPARMRWIELRGEIMRGLVPNLESGSRPVLEAWLGGRWVATDTYIFDAAYMAAARQRLRELGWERGFGIHRDGQAIWNGIDDAWAGGQPVREDPMFMADLGAFHDPQQFIESQAYRSKHRPLARTMRWNMRAPFMERAIRELRADAAAPPPDAQRRTS
jgi:transglutaminase-like putative cysteine protease